jgi:isopenicillin N synthase-like dioxygenase
MANSFVCNIGDMLDRMTGGQYQSTPHRVRNSSGRSRYSYPFFFDPNFHSRVELLPIVQSDRVRDDSNERWDRANPHAFDGTYGDYLLNKVGKVFPQLKATVIK